MPRGVRVLNDDDAYALHDVYDRVYVHDHDDAHDLRYVYVLRDDHDDVYVHGGARRDDHVRVCDEKNATYETIYQSHKFCAAIQ